MTENLITIGESIFNATKIVSKAAHEIIALRDYIHKALQERLVGNINDIREFYEDENETDDDTDDTGWVYIGEIINYKIKLKGKQKPSACLAIQTSLSSDDEEFLAGKQPLLHVLFCGENDPAWEYDEFQLPPSYGEDDYEYKLKENCFWDVLPTNPNSDEEKDWTWIDRQWGFSLPLVALNTHQDLTTQIVDPVVALIEGKSPKEAFKKADKVLRFKFNKDNKLELLSR